VRESFKVLMVLDFFPPHRGGVESLFDELSRGLASLGHQVTVVTQQLPGTRPTETAGNLKIKRVRTFGRRSLFPLLAVPSAVRLARQSDIIQTSTYFSAAPAKCAGCLANKPVVLTVHEVSGKDWSRYTGLSGIQAWILRLVEAVVLRMRFHRYVCVSESTNKRAVAAGVPASKTRTVYNGVDEDWWGEGGRNREKLRERFGFSGRFVYLFYGRPGFSKGLEYLVQAVPCIAESVPQSLFFAIVSQDETYRSRLNRIEAMSKGLRAKDQMRMIPSVSKEELTDYVYAADCVVVPSITEGFGLCVAEACAMGRPVVASETTSIPEVVSGKYRLVEPRNPKSIAEGLVAGSRGQWETAPARHFPWEETVQGYLKVYEELAPTHCPLNP